MGGRRLAAAGMQLIVDAEKDASVMGFGEILGSIGRLLSAIARLKKLITKWRPDAVVLIDFPDFNMRIGRYAHAHGVPVFYYITPKLWAWREGRVRFFRKHVSRAACIFPFEPDFFSARGFAAASYVGHPFATRYAGFESLDPGEKRALRRDLGLAEEATTICFFPGSRAHEIREHSDLISETWRRFHARHPDTQAVLSIASSVDAAALQNHFGSLDQFSLIGGRQIDLLRASDAGMIKSGTSNLQAAFCGLPFFMFYRASRFSAFIARRFVKLDEYSIVNIIRKGTVRELLQEEAVPEVSAAELERLVYDDAYRTQVKSGLAEVRTRLAAGGTLEGNSASERAAGLLLQLADRRAFL